ncbi:hypothetical protein [Pseudomonas sp. LP_7_YM]|uniref:hypothetical protein n=1 Tax=Pseudomonas sp. LP_7_YM TaxID=2485137 RepID=UPI00105F624C|nr:hypothetical protein [Pseudomonas sp. LP_7_YM]TDV70446.1 hypothetical protein EC915_102713 [Pseudomonas sp. LP_7_YM]
MTPLIITLLVVAGIVLLIAIGYLNHVAENNKVERARALVELNDRFRRCSELSETFPGQLMTPALKLLLVRLELNVIRRLLALEKRSNPAIQERQAELDALVAQGDNITISNPVSPIQTEAKAKDVRFLLEAMHGQVTRAAHDGFLQTAEAKQWIREIRNLLVLLHIEFFNNLGQQALNQEQPGQARLAFERGVQYLKNQAEPAPWKTHLQAMERQLARANGMVLDTIAPTEEDNNELTEGLKEVEADAEWKKKAIYD